MAERCLSKAVGKVLAVLRHTISSEVSKAHSDLLELQKFYSIPHVCAVITHKYSAHYQRFLEE